MKESSLHKAWSELHGECAGDQTQRTRKVELEQKLAMETKAVRFFEWWTYASRFVCF